MKILIAVPSTDYVPSSFAQSLAALNRPEGYEVNLSFISGSLIYDARNRIAKQAIQMEADYVMWFDADMIFDPDTLIQLLNDINSNKEIDIISGLYHRRSIPYSPVLFKKLKCEGDKNWEDYDNHPDGIFELDGVGFGCVLHKASVLFDMACKYGDWFTPINGYGEDLSFCIRAKELGFKVFCDSNVKCGHYGHVMVTEEFYKAYRGDANES